MKKTLEENDSIQDLGTQSRNSRRHMNNLERDHYGVDVPELLKTVRNLAEVMARILDREDRNENSKCDSPAHYPAGYGGAPAVAKGPCP